MHYCCFVVVVVLFLPVGTQHWLCTSYEPTVGVRVMDSLFKEQLTPCTKLQLAKIYSRTVPSTQSFIKVEVVTVQQQFGNSDCGLYSIANAVEACMGNNPRNIHYVQKRMRNHLENCFNKGIISCFPQLGVQSFC